MPNRLRQSSLIPWVTLVATLYWTGALASRVLAVETVVEKPRQVKTLELTQNEKSWDESGEQANLLEKGEKTVNASQSSPASDLHPTDTATTPKPASSSSVNDFADDTSCSSITSVKIAATNSIAPTDNSAVSSPSAQDDCKLTSSKPLNKSVSHSAVDLGKNPLVPSAINLFEDRSNLISLFENTANLNEYKLASDAIPIEPGKPLPSRAVNLLAVRALKKPVGGKVLDTGFDIAGIRPRDTTESFWTRDFLTGNWGGARDELYKHGIDITLVQFLEDYGVVSGGKQQASAYNGISVISFDLYTDGLKLWHGGQVHLTTSWLEGTASVGRDYAGAINSVYFSDPLVKGYRLFELWYGQKFFNNELEVRVGKIYPFVKIAASQTSSLFTNTAFNYPTFLGSTPSSGLAYAYGDAPFGVQILYTPTPKFFFFSNFADGFNDPTGGIVNRYGLDVGLSATRGLEGILEVGYKVNQEKGSTGLPGTYRLGFQFNTGEFQNNHLNTDGLSLALFGGTGKPEWGDSAFYFMAEQMLYSESPNPSDRRQGLTGFFKTTISPNQDVNTITLNLAGGLAYEGPFPGRDRDILALGTSYSRISNGQRDYDIDLRLSNPGTVVRDSETVVELVYAAEIAPWWVMIGSLQRIIHPSGSSSATDDATVLGISSRFAL